jgi:hypothetical protein
MRTSVTRPPSAHGITHRRLSPGEDQQLTLLYGDAITNYQQESNMHQLLNGLHPAIALALNPFFTQPNAICPVCKTESNPAMHRPEDCKVITDMQAAKGEKTTDWSAS